tara:strand:- start:2755 stop:3033 length:279 start_codon:yes stop_codon:yes gene_type:complete
MNFRPVNRYIHIKLSEPTPIERESAIVLPQDYTPPTERYAVAKVLSCADDVRFKDTCHPGASAIVDQSMVEEILINNKKITVILDNYVIGMI